MPDQPNDEPPNGFAFPADYASCIADIVNSWATLEHNIDMSIWHMAGVYPAIGACITSQIYTLDGRLKGLQSLLKLRQAPKELTKLVNKFSERVRKPQEIRNRIIHDHWRQSLDRQRMFQLEVGAKNTLTYGFKMIAIEMLKNDRDSVKSAMMESSDIRSRIEDSLPTLPEIPLQELHPTVLHPHSHKRTRSTDNTFLLFPPKPSRR
jgi:hypothetical protein